MYVYILYIHSCKYMHSFSSTSLCVGSQRHLLVFVLVDVRI